jgi:DMSO reductase anchor subunit
VTGHCRFEEFTMDDFPTDLPLTASSPGVSDAIRVQILATEHWSLLATRSMTWNEMFTRASMFLTVLSASVVALALVAQATDFGGWFSVFALLLLPIVLLLGVGAQVRLGAARREDVWFVQGMNRLRHGYLDVAPELAPYFVTDHHDDVAGVLRSSFEHPRLSPGQLVSATPAIVGNLNAIVAGVLLALICATLGAPVAVSVGAGVVASIAYIGASIMIAVREIARVRGAWQSHFPS